MWILGADSFTEVLIGAGVRLFIIFFILPIHEFAHAWAAYGLGDPTAKNVGRLSLNPIRHIDPVGAILIFLVNFGWAKPVPVNPINFNNQRRRQGGMAWVSFAGPLSNIICAFLGTGIMRILLSFSAIYTGENGLYLLSGLNTFVSINCALAIFNLLPVPPLDGSKILNWILSDKWTYKLDRFLSQYSMIVTIVFLAMIFGGLFDGVIGFMSSVILNSSWFVFDFILNLLNLPTLVEIGW
ncbi:MAG: site-2 protease family protein [Oscillospiraceae bacterium]|jgi:Zn-dependent protease|nr:site-2 protease family protein [Oscillospiraceae bacterium]